MCVVLSSLPCISTMFFYALWKKINKNKTTSLLCLILLTYVLAISCFPISLLFYPLKIISLAPIYFLIRYAVDQLCIPILTLIRTKSATEGHEILQMDTHRVRYLWFIPQLWPSNKPNAHRHSTGSLQITWQLFRHSVCLLWTLLFWLIIITIKILLADRTVSTVLHIFSFYANVCCNNRLLGIVPIIHTHWHLIQCLSHSSA